MYSRHFRMSSSYLLLTVLYSRLNRMPSNLEFCVWTWPKESESKDANESKRECSRHDSADPVEEEGNRDGSKDRIPEEKRIKNMKIIKERRMASLKGEINQVLQKWPREFNYLKDVTTHHHHKIRNIFSLMMFWVRTQRPLWTWYQNYSKGKENDIYVYQDDPMYF